ncbi:unnamed protein product [Lactuca virosa]|uniref:Uncharacterized protein n=1 Tax=Lactuca virosa TaxID=75947 RepID=A0AAU9MRB9_9ASTR|nr:unnamed protein product [Lactuca virosa]
MWKLLVAGVEKRVDFLDVLAKKWVSSLQYRDVDLVDRVLPSFYFCLAIEWRLCPRRLVGGVPKVTTVQSEVIDISDELNVEKTVVPDLKFHVDDIVADRSVTPEFSHRVEAVDVDNAGGAQFLGFGHGGDVVAFKDGDQGSSYLGFFPCCSLKDDSHSANRLELFFAIDEEKNHLRREMHTLSFTYNMDRLEMDVLEVKKIDEEKDVLKEKVVGLEPNKVSLGVVDQLK